MSIRRDKVTDSFTFIWNVRDYLLCPRRYIRSSSFTSVILRNSHWHLCLDLRSPGNVEYIDCYLYRNRDDKGPLQIQVCVKITVSGQDVESYEKGQMVGRCYTKKCSTTDSLCIARIRQEPEFFNSELKIECFMCPIYKNRSEKVSDDNPNMISLSADMMTLLEKGLFYDTILIAENKKFKVHRSILQVRTPNLAIKIPISFTPEIYSIYELKKVSELTMKYLLTYVYSGSLPTGALEDFKNLNRIAELFEITDLKNLLNSWIKKQRVITEMNIHKKTFVWIVDTYVLWGTISLPYVRRILADNLKVARVWMFVQMQSNVSGDNYLHVAFECPTVSETDPIMVSCKLTITDEDDTRHSFKLVGSLIQMSERWTSEPLISRDELQSLVEKSTDPNRINFQVELVLCDGIKATSKEQNGVVLSGTHYLTFRYHIRKMYKNVVFYDMNLLTESGHSFSAHRGVLAARSRVLREMMEKEGMNRCITLVGIDRETLSALLDYIYTAEWKYTSHDSCVRLQRAAEYYEVASLQSCISQHLSDLEQNSA